jgi:hypothetical protein
MRKGLCERFEVFVYLSRVGLLADVGLGHYTLLLKDWLLLHLLWLTHHRLLTTEDTLTSTHHPFNNITQIILLIKLSSLMTVLLHSVISN